MKTDIESRADIDTLMVRFYEKAMTDPVIGYFFTEVVQLDLEHHLPIIGDFWETALFGSGAYRKHALRSLAGAVHRDRRRFVRGHVRKLHQAARAGGRAPDAGLRHDERRGVAADHVVARRRQRAVRTSFVISCSSASVRSWCTPA
jgi:truncated hemoglobin YjbI